MADMRTVFAETASVLLDEDPLTAVVLAEISADMFAKAAARHPERVLNVGIREQLMVSVGGGLALAGMRPRRSWSSGPSSRSSWTWRIRAFRLSWSASGRRTTRRGPGGRTRRRKMSRLSTGYPGSPWSCRGTRRRCPGCCAGRWAHWMMALLICGCPRRPTRRRFRCGRGCRWCVRGGWRWWSRWGPCSRRYWTALRTWT